MVRLKKVNMLIIQSILIMTIAIRVDLVLEYVKRLK